MVVRSRQNFERINRKNLKIVALHNAANALAAVALCRGIGVEYAPIIQTLYNFKGFPAGIGWNGLRI